MASDETPKETGLAGAGKWCAIASELPCSVIVMMFIGQLLGGVWYGPAGATWGAIVGVLLGFVIGTVSVYKTVGHYEEVEKAARTRRQYMPPMEEILEDVEFPLDEEKPD